MFKVTKKIFLALPLACIGLIGCNKKTSAEAVSVTKTSVSTNPADSGEFPPDWNTALNNAIARTRDAKRCVREFKTPQDAIAFVPLFLDIRIQNALDNRIALLHIAAMKMAHRQTLSTRAQNEEFNLRKNEWEAADTAWLSAIKESPFSSEFGESLKAYCLIPQNAAKIREKIDDITSPTIAVMERKYPQLADTGAVGAIRNIGDDIKRVYLLPRPEVLAVQVEIDKIDVKLNQYQEKYEEMHRKRNSFLDTNNFIIDVPGPTNALYPQWTALNESYEAALNAVSELERARRVLFKNLADVKRKFHEEW